MKSKNHVVKNSFPGREDRDEVLVAPPREAAAILPEKKTVHDRPRVMLAVALRRRAAVHRLPRRVAAAVPQGKAPVAAEVTAEVAVAVAVEAVAEHN